MRRELTALRHYRPAQIAHRLANRARRLGVSLAPARLRHRLSALQENPPPARASACPEALRAHLLDPAVVPPATADDLLQGRLDFLGAPRTYGARIDWRPRGPQAPSHLWRIHLHYHRFGLEAVVGALRRPADAQALLDRAADLLLDWSRACPPGERATFEDAWSPYSASVRLLHGWMARRLLEEIGAGAADRLRRVLDGRAAADAAFLAGWLEHDLGGNHLLRNAVGLMAAGRWLSGPLGDRCRREGDALLAREAKRQILADGLHEERSPMYHAILVEDLLSLVPADAQEKELPARLLRALAAVTHPDGEIALFNDSAFGVVPPPQLLRRLAEGLGVPPGPAEQDLPAAGYFRLGDGGDAVIFDAGPLGPDHLPAHAHCDALSFELSLSGTRVVTDTGVDRYEAGPERSFQRGTGAHATLQVDGREQAEPFGSFRMGRRPTVRGRRTSATAVEGEHDGFGEAGLHRRRLRFAERSVLAWEDEVTGAREVPVVVRLGLAPAIAATPEPGGARLVLPGGGALRWKAPAQGGVTVEPGVSCPAFGRQDRRPVLCWRGTAGRGRVLAFELTRE